MGTYGVRNGISASAPQNDVQRNRIKFQLSDFPRRQNRPEFAAAVCENRHQATGEDFPAKGPARGVLLPWQLPVLCGADYLQQRGLGLYFHTA